MIIKIKNEDSNLALSLLNKNNISNETFDTEYECFIKKDIKDFEDTHSGHFGKDTFRRLSNRVYEELMNVEIYFVHHKCKKILKEYDLILKKEQLGRCITLPSGEVLLLKDIICDKNYNDLAIITCDNEIYECVINYINGECFVNLKGFTISLIDFY